MNKKHFKREQERIEKLIDRWVDTLGLARWRITFSYHEEPLSARDEHGLVQVDDSISMDTESDWRYREASIRVAFHQTACMDDDYLEYVFVHELCHILLAEMPSNKKEKSADHEERTACDIAHALIMVRKAGRDEHAQG